MKNYLTKFFIIITLLAQVGLPVAYALEDTFNTSLTIAAEDFVAPSIPANLVATAVSTSQINLSWSASTDDVGVQGYRIFRDSLIIASTTGTTYSDTDLIASTTYAYTVEAFDSIPRYSGQSNTATTTTLAPSAPGSGGAGGSVTGTNLRPIISNLVTVPAQTFALVNFTTNEPAIAKIQWGTTSDYELGSMSGSLYNTIHSLKIDNLNAGTVYYFKIEVVNAHNISAFVQGSFVTENIVQYVIPNVTDFKATPQKKNTTIELDWENPRGFDFDSIRVVKSDKFFPRDPSEGEIVYEGRGEEYTDENVEEGVTYFYSIFVKDLDGKYSSGALAQARILKDGETAATSTDPFAGITIINNVHPDIAKLTLLDFDFIQDGRKIMSEANTIAIDGSKNLTILLDYSKVPEVLKTIAFTLSDPDDSTSVFPFLLRVNDEKTAYEATIAPLGKDGNYGLSVTILDYKNQGLKRIEGSLKAFVFGSIEGILSNNANIFRNNYLIWIWLILLVAVVYIMSHLNRKSSDKGIKHEA